MKTTFLGLSAFLWIALASPAPAEVGTVLHLDPSGPATVDVGFFYDELAPYGHWVETPRYGWAFAPAVEPAWRPYAYGQWVQTDLGWTWLSDEPFGWATYHYGRWDLDPVYGWMWIPGDEWAPAWVSWRATDDYIGWAPLPPAWRVRPRFGFRLAGAGPPDEAFLFVPEPLFLEPVVVAYALPPGQAKKLFRSSRDFTRYRVVNNLIVNEGVPLDRIQRRLGRPVPRLQLADLETDRGRRARIAGNRIDLFRPRVSKARVATPPARPIARGSVMTARDAAKTRQVARDARAGVFETKRVVRRQDTVRPREVRQGRSAEAGRLRAGPPQREIRQGRGAEGRRLQASSQRDIRQGRGRAEVRRTARAAGPERRIREQRSDRPSRKSASPSRRPDRRQSLRPAQRHDRPQRAVRPDRQGGGGRKGAMRNQGGAPQGKGKRGGGRKP